MLEQLRLSVAHSDPHIAVLVFVLSLAAHVSSDEAAMNGLSLVFGPEWPARTVFVWSNAELLGSGSLNEYLHNAERGLQQLLIQAGGGSIEINTRGAEEHLEEQEHAGCCELSLLSLCCCCYHWVAAIGFTIRHGASGSKDTGGGQGHRSDCRYRPGDFNCRRGLWSAPKAGFCDGRVAEQKTRPTLQVGTAAAAIRAQQREELWGVRLLCTRLCQLFHAAVPSSAVDTRHLSDDKEVDDENETIELIEAH